MYHGHYMTQIDFAIGLRAWIWFSTFQNLFAYILQIWWWNWFGGSHIPQKNGKLNIATFNTFTVILLTDACMHIREMLIGNFGSSASSPDTLKKLI